jgi:hypothetical protein
VVGENCFEGIQAAILNLPLLGLEKKSNFHFFPRREFEFLFKLEKIRIGCPSKIMNAFLEKMVSCRSLFVFYLLSMFSSSSNDIGGRKCDFDIICSVLRKKFGPELMLMAIPFAIDKNPDFGEPLADKIKKFNK